MTLSPAHVGILELAQKMTPLADVPPHQREALDDLVAAEWVRMKSRLPG